MLSLLGFGEDPVRLLQVDACRSSDQVGDHDVGYWLVRIILELEIAVGDDSKELGTELAGFCSERSSVMHAELRLLKQLVNFRLGSLYRSPHDREVE